MRVVTEHGRLRFQSTRTTSRPFIVWVTRRCQLLIEPDDTIAKVAIVIMDELRASPESAARLAAFYFALGERDAFKMWREPWNGDELDASPTRRYLRDAAWTSRVRPVHRDSPSRTSTPRLAGPDHPSMLLRSQDPRRRLVPVGDASPASSRSRAAAEAESQAANPATRDRAGSTTRSARR
jgi:hypothetical protein